jgi:hypothetical protein
MPLVRIDLVQGKSAEYRRTIGTIVYEAMVDVLTVPKNDRFQIPHRRRKLSWYPAHTRLHFYSTDAQCWSNR